MEESTDNLAWQMRTSPILNAVSAMTTLLRGWNSDPWVRRAREIVGPNYLESLTRTFRPFRDGLDLCEVAIWTSPGGTVEEFLAKLEAMDPSQFLHYVLGRIVPMGSDLDRLERADFKDLFEHFGDYAHYAKQIMDRGSQLPGGSWTAYGPELKSEYCRLIDEIWSRLLRAEWPQNQEQIQANQVANETHAKEHGSIALYRLVSDRDRLPDMVPPDTPTQRLFFYAVSHLPSWAFSFVYGGEIHLVYRADRTPGQIDRLTNSMNNTIAATKALGDPTRLDILRMVFLYDGVLNGQNIVRKTGLAKSVISKHMRQLVDAGLVREETPDNRNTIYFANRYAVQELSTRLTEILGGPPMGE